MSDIGALIPLLVDGPADLRQWFLQYAPMGTREMIIEWVVEAGTSILADEAGLRERVVGQARGQDGPVLKGAEFDATIAVLREHLPRLG